MRTTPHTTGAGAARRRATWRLAVAVLGVAALVGIGLLAATSISDDAVSGVRVSMTEYAFAPDPIRADDGRLTVVNDGDIDHVLLVPALAKGTADLAPGDRMVLDLSDQPSGIYRVVCDLPGHLEAGMEAQLVLP